MTLDTISAVEIPLATLLKLSPDAWHKEHLWNFSVLQTVHLYSLALIATTSIVLCHKRMKNCEMSYRFTFKLDTGSSLNMDHGGGGTTTEFTCQACN
jgi:hypothetical protein